MHNIHINCTNFEQTNAIKKHVKEHLLKTRHHFENSISDNISIYLKKIKNGFQAKFILPTKRNRITVSSTSENMYEAINDASLKAFRQVRKIKEKNNKHH